MSSNSQGSIEATSRRPKIDSAPPHPPKHNTTGSDRRLRSTTRLGVMQDKGNDSLLPSSHGKPIRLAGKNRTKVTTKTKGTIATTTNRALPDQVRVFADAIRTAMNTLMQDHGYSRERAKISLLDQLVSLSKLQPAMATSMNTLKTPTVLDDLISSGNVPDSSVQSPAITISDTKVRSISPHHNFISVYRQIIRTQMLLFYYYLAIFLL